MGQYHSTQEGRRPILVTGTHRSGTTWVGKMLVSGAQAAYISEPLNRLHRPGVMRVPVKKWYTYICPDNEQIYLPALQETIALRYHIWAEIQSLRSRKDFLRMSRDFSFFLRGRIFSQRPLLKDPFAAFSAPWFTERLKCQVVVIIRHPAAIASSLKRLKWPFDFQDLLEQPLLMRDWLEPFREEMLQIQAEDVIGQSALLWRMIYPMLDVHAKQNPDIRILRHEDLSLEPHDCFRDLFGFLGLNFNTKAQAAVQRSTHSSNPREQSRSAVHAVRLDSRANIENWKSRLTPGEIERIRSLIGETASPYYPEDSWL